MTRWPGGLRVSRIFLADAALLLVTLIWGSTFVMVKDAVATYPVFGFLAIRFTCAALAMLPLMWLRRRSGAQAVLPARALGEKAWHAAPRLVAPVLIGAALFAGYALQTAGLRLTTPAKAGFITGLSVVIVPVISALLLRQPPPRAAWFGVGLALGGLALLSLTADLRLAPGDLLVLGCTLSFAAHILLTGHFAARHDPLRLTFGQIVVVAGLSWLAALLFDHGVPSPLPILPAAVFTGVLATALAFGVQTVAQRFTTATHTALIFTAEPVFAGLFSFLLIGELLGPRQALGCALILGGMVVGEMRGGDGVTR